MPLVLNEEQEMLREAAQGFLKDHAPVKALRALRDSGDETGFSRDLWAQMAGMGWAGILVPEEAGGSGFGFVGAGVIAEEMGRNLTASPFLSTAILAATALNRAGSAERRGEALSLIAAGKRIYALAVDEGRKHAPLNIELKAEKSGNGFKLSGAKSFVADGHVADRIIVAARTGGAPGEAEGLTLFDIDAKSAGMSFERTVMVDSRNAARIEFDGVQVAGDDILGEIDNGYGVLDGVLNAGRAGLAAEMTGSAAQAFETTMDYIRERKQFGAPIGSFQALQHRAAHLFTEIEMARAVVLNALQVLDDNFDNAGIAVSLAKAKVSKVATLAAQEGIQMHGGMGMTDEFDIGLYIKRIRVAQEMFGDVNHHSGRIATMLGY